MEAAKIDQVKMKYTVFGIIAALACSNAFSPAPSTTCVSVAADALADRIFGMDLFAPVADQNNYGAHTRKNIKVGQIADRSYVPNGLTKEQYNAIRSTEKKKKDNKYAANVKKAGIFIDFTDWYAKRGIELSGDWKGKTTLGHSMAKTKFDWSGSADAKPFESTKVEKFSQSSKKPPSTASAKKVAPKKAGVKRDAPPKKTFSFK